MNADGRGQILRIIKSAGEACENPRPISEVTSENTWHTPFVSFIGGNSNGLWIRTTEYGLRNTEYPHPSRVVHDLADAGELRQALRRVAGLLQRADVDVLYTIPA